MTTAATPLDPAALLELGSGTGRVHSVSVRAGETWLTLGYPGGLRVVVAVPDVPQRGAEGDRRLRDAHPLAVRMTTGPTSFECSVLVTSRRGPRRLGISTSLALSLSAAGVHTVLCTR